MTCWRRVYYCVAVLIVWICHAMLLLSDVKPLLNVKRSIEIGNCPTPKKNETRLNHIFVIAIRPDTLRCVPTIWQLHHRRLIR